MKTKASVIFAASAMLVGTPAFAASDYLLKLDGVDGEASATIEVASWSFGVCNAGQCSTVKSPRDAASGQATGKVKHVPTKISNASQNTQSLRGSPTGTTAVAAPASAEKTNPGKGSWDLATGKGARTAGGVNVAAGDVDGDGRADLAYAGTQDQVTSFTLSFDKASPVLAKVCQGKHFASVTLSRGTEVIEITDATYTCSVPAGGKVRPPADADCSSNGCDDAKIVFTGGQMKHTKTGHVTLLK